MGRLDGAKVTVQSSLEDIDFIEIIKQNIFKAAVRCMNEWQDNLEKGIGAEGFHGGEYRDTGKTINDVVITPKHPALKIDVGGDDVALAIAEFGRAPNSRMPPHKPIARWVKRKGLSKPDSMTWYSFVFLIRRRIAERGLRGFAPARLAAVRVQADIDRQYKREIDDALEAAAKDKKDVGG